MIQRQMLSVASLLICSILAGVPALAQSPAEGSSGERVTLSAPAADVANEWQRRWDDGAIVIHSVRERYGRDGEYLVEGIERADGSIHVRITHVSGALVFQSTFPVREADGPHVQWTYRDGMEMVTKSARLKGPELPRVETMMVAAKEIVRIVVTARERTGKSPDDADSPRRGRVGSLDSWGCDLPDWSGFDISCSAKGNCCDTHDGCFATFDCSADSWIYGTAAGVCHLCNLAAVACFTTGLLDTGQPSACCELGNCGMERCTGASYDDPNCGTWSEGGGDDSCGRCVQNIDPNSGGGGGGGWSYGPDGSISYSGGTCCFPPSHSYPDGICLPCG